MAIYTTDNDELQVAIHHYPVDGFQCTVSRWDGDDFIVLYDSRMIADSVWEGIGSALTRALGIEWDEADSMMAEWGIFAPDEEGDE